MRYVFLTTIFCVATLSTLGTTRVTAQDGALPTGVSVDELLGTVLRRSLWRDSALKVCWENPTDENLDGRNIVEAAVNETWLAASGLTVTGWDDKCPAPKTKGKNLIRILVNDDELPRAEALGIFLADRPNGLVLNFTLNTFWPGRCDGAKELRDCIYVVAVHEFGHVLGFTHEQNRDDAPEVCRRDHHAGTVGDYKVTTYDLASIMNACNAKWNGDGKLSDLDKVALAEVYGDEK